MKISIISLMIGITVLSVPAFASQRAVQDSGAYPLTVLVKHALEAQPSVAISFLDIERRHQETNMSKSSLYPTLDATSETSQKNKSDGDENNIENKISLAYRIADFGVRSNNIEKSESVEESSASDFLQSMNTTAKETTDAFLNIEKLKNILASIDEEKIFYKKMLNDFSELINSGVAMQSDLRKVQASIDALSTQELTYRSQADTELAKIRNMTGDAVTLENISRLPDVFDAYQFDTDSKSVIKQVMRDNPTWRSLQKNTDAAYSDIKAARAANYPTIDANVDYTDNNPSGDAEPDDYRDEVRFGVKIGFNIFNGFKNQSEESKFAARYGQSKLESDDFILKSRNSIDVSLSKYRSNLEALDIAKRSYDNADKMTELYKEEFNLGQKSLLDVISSRNELFQAHISMIESTYGIYQSKLEQMSQISTLLKVLQLQNDVIKPGSRSLLR
ncbi:TolC family protein [Rahnella perminowiae]|uniref:TolC family protein n=2 Tax=Rahnella perminowiae TaxID=2816244 RepID=A0ABS6KX13_9GAMM|nr:TolC family protein [Rahnella perminowiae]MBU9826381.1 TolC family protein [Rahnella perminowiae]MBU9834140.1 TolC family protein [Rahnella perminowiae]MCX2945976.1 TolC family protein [Rahnella perminowiae]UJD88972.1 TolC family protein [Rahnella aquatilis]